MIKPIHIYSAIFIFILANSGCKKFIDTAPYSTVSTEQFYKTAADAELALAGCYNVLNAKQIQGTNLGTQGGLYFMQLQNMLTAGTDEAFARVTSATNETQLGQLSWDANTTYFRQVWFYFYAGIQRCNLLLDHLENIPDISEARKTEIKGEARFLRGFYLLYLGMMFGGVPINTTSTPDLQAPRASVQQVFSQVIEDLQYAYDVLPPKASIYDRANKWSAAGFLAKAYAFMGSCKQNNVNKNLDFPLNDFDWVDINDSYTKVKELTDSIVTYSGYKLTENYSYLFRETTQSSQDEECLFMAVGSTDPVNGNGVNMQNGFVPQGANATLGGGLARLVPLGELFYKYHNKDPRRGNNLTQKLNASNPMEVAGGAQYYVPTAVTANSIKNNFFYYGGKFRMIDPATKTVTLYLWTGNYPILRLAEIYLLRAEATYMLTNDAATARADLYTVRQRSIAPADMNTVNTAYAKSDFIEELLDERSRELCFEAVRRFDLVRFGRYQSTINALSTDNSLSKNNTEASILKQNFAPKHIWFPIPEPERILNPSLIQNPKY
ncbi:RagB/SusD family nutrient uptake outer membrane protein (plasmid) [Pedobacter sp. BS3]|uniref:RagB/SusD family nutrient uptake outer membrane protein n=1 Tax=Pedobacter sp. BS3 TaxID=2567937 RepID=UPI0011ECF577|nr:RagB/SusD family nutrient uptake outer membrane protein [Pedobacter sp. BS3]TZF86471.1 RagB/SusD family nutrient uptake outer membrane protein [Pedobacter sp. BS3]